MAFPYFFNFQGQWQLAKSFFLEASMASSLSFLLFRIHLIGMIKSKDISFKLQQFFLQIIFQEVLLFGKFWILTDSTMDSTSSQQQIKSADDPQIQI